jgi:hypothetical protein
MKLLTCIALTLSISLNAQFSNDVERLYSYLDHQNLTFALSLGEGWLNNLDLSLDCEDQMTRVKGDIDYSKVIFLMDSQDVRAHVSYIGGLLTQLGYEKKWIETDSGKPKLWMFFKKSGNTFTEIHWLGYGKDSAFLASSKGELVINKM